ncbi:MAG: hypothetical protein M1828_000675 [Chrysothrix sp. TS-e1954]|nr:MAG: hypothetical protein M1828_000675 [Chrysothrix sp. TS-e1954]
MVDRPRKPSAISPSLTSDPLTTQPTVNITSSTVTASLATGETVTILPHGATVTSWKTRSSSNDLTENLWLSSAAALDGSKPVRGGIPLVFPVFGPPPKDHPTSSLPQHGFARNARWEFLGKSTSESGAIGKSKGDDSVKLDFGLSHTGLSEEARKQWPFKFGLIYSVSLSKGELQCMLNVRNEGEEAWDFQMLLHTYFRVKDITQTQLTGLLSAPCTDRVAPSTTPKPESQHSISITGEMDRVYTGISQDTTSILESGQPRLDIVRDNLRDTVVWNPWREKAAKMAGFEPKDGYKSLLAVEVGAVDGWTRLEGDDTFEAGMIVRAH